MFFHTVLFLGLIFFANAASRPEYIIPCSRSRNFSECALKSSRHAIQFLVKGDRQLKIPSMNPLKVELVELNGTSNLHLKLTNLKLYGLDKLKITSVRVDFEKRSALIKSFLDRSVLLAEYEISGKILMFPLTGHGPLNMTILNASYEYDATWELVTREGNQYMKFTSSRYDYVVDQIIYDFKNLFNGDKFLGEAMNKFLNENWEIVNADLKAPFLETLLVFHNDISKKIFSDIPYDELFLE